MSTTTSFQDLAGPVTGAPSRALPVRAAPEREEALHWPLPLRLVAGVPALLVVAVAGWICSALAAAKAGGALLPVAVLSGFALLPLAWELGSRFQRSGADRKTAPLRVGLRAAALSAVVLATVALATPDGGLGALQTYGDWMLPAQGGHAIELVRELLLDGASLLARLLGAA